MCLFLNYDRDWMPFWDVNLFLYIKTQTINNGHSWDLVNKLLARNPDPSLLCVLLAR